MAEGRPREFDPTESLDQALKVFWARGYDGAGIAELTEAMGINRPSLYAAFGNKQELFEQALNRYVDARMHDFYAALEAPTGREAAEGVLLASAAVSTERGWPKGCFGVRGALSTSVESDAARRKMASWRMSGERALHKRLLGAQEDGDLAPGVDAGELSRFILAVTQGMSVQAATGATRKQLHRIAERAMLAWPD